MMMENSFIFHYINQSQHHYYNGREQHSRNYYSHCIRINEFSQTGKSLHEELAEQLTEDLTTQTDDKLAVLSVDDLTTQTDDKLAVLSVDDLQLHPFDDNRLHSGKYFILVAASLQNSSDFR